MKQPVDGSCETERRQCLRARLRTVIAPSNPKMAVPPAITLSKNQFQFRPICSSLEIYHSRDLKRLQITSILVYRAYINLRLKRLRLQESGRDLNTSKVHSELHMTQLSRLRLEESGVIQLPPKST